MKKKQIKISILVDPGTAPPEEIADVLSEISKLYRMMGGSGINWAVKDIEYDWRSTVILKHELNESKKRKKPKNDNPDSDQN